METGPLLTKAWPCCLLFIECPLRPIHVSKVQDPLNLLRQLFHREIAVRYPSHSLFCIFQTIIWLPFESSSAWVEDGTSVAQEDCKIVLSHSFGLLMTKGVFTWILVSWCHTCRPRYLARLLWFCSRARQNQNQLNPLSFSTSCLAGQHSLLEGSGIL